MFCDILILRSVRLDFLVKPEFRIFDIPVPPSLYIVALLDLMDFFMGDELGRDFLTAWEIDYIAIAKQRARARIECRFDLCIIGGIVGNGFQLFKAFAR